AAGSWNEAPLLSVALASSTWKLSPAGAGSKKILLVLSIRLKSFPLREEALSPPFSCTKIRRPSLLFMSAVLSFGTPMMLRLKCEPLGAPLPVVALVFVLVVTTLAVVVVAGAVITAAAASPGTAAIAQATPRSKMRLIR